MTGVPTCIAPPHAGAVAIAAACALAMLAALAPMGPVARVTRVQPVPRLVDLSRAPVAELCLLDGVGPSLAARIVAHRAVHGPYGSPEELLAIEGIGPATLEALRRGARAGSP